MTAVKALGGFTHTVVLEGEDSFAEGLQFCCFEIASIHTCRQRFGSLQVDSSSNRPIIATGPSGSSNNAVVLLNAMLGS